jgi:uncharacterized protein (DUF433 family)
VTRRPRRDVIVRRFLAGWSFNDLVYQLGCNLRDVEAAIRWAFEKWSKR